MEQELLSKPSTQATRQNHGTESENQRSATSPRRRPTASYPRASRQIHTCRNRPLNTTLPNEPERDHLLQPTKRLILICDIRTRRTRYIRRQARSRKHKHKHTISRAAQPPPMLSRPPNDRAIPTRPGQPSVLHHIHVVRDARQHPLRTNKVVVSRLKDILQGFAERAEERYG